jgi:hypothetical protein
MMRSINAHTWPKSEVPMVGRQAPFRGGARRSVHCGRRLAGGSGGNGERRITVAQDWTDRGVAASSECRRYTVAGRDR